MTRTIGNDNSVDTAAWSTACVLCIILGLAVATCKYCRDQYGLPENRRKRKEKEEEGRIEKEERAVRNVCREAIPRSQFLQVLKKRKLDKNLNVEVRAIVRNQEEFPCTVASSSENADKNITDEVLPFDHSRIPLRDPPSHAHNDYINAAYIDGYCMPKEYIATQGPRHKLVDSFWHLVWQESVQCIVMATGVFENATQQCDKYWGDYLSLRSYVKHGDIQIINEDELLMSQLNIRTLRLKRVGYSEEKVVKHFEMIGFSDESTDPAFLLDCRRRIRSHMETVAGPMLVHCRCGGGRTAVLIAVDYCLRELEDKESVDIYSAVLHLRKYRKNMVRTLNQYRLIYDTLAMYIQCGITVTCLPKLPEMVERLSSISSGGKITGFEKEFQTLHSIVPKLSIGDCAGGHRSENRNKSRDIMLLPPERARPYLLTTETGDTSTDFINAVFVDGHHQVNSYLITQWPLKGTINDIWKMFYDYKITTVVLLNDVNFSRGYPCFWPRDLETEWRYGPIVVKYMGCQISAHMETRTFTIRKRPKYRPKDFIAGAALGFGNGSVADMQDDGFVIKMFQLTCWGKKDKTPPTPRSTKSLIHLMGCVENWQQQTNPMNPVCVMSKDGYSRVGLYCTLSLCCEQLKSENEVDIFNCVRQVKKNRPQLLPNSVEYTYCYTFMLTILEILEEETTPKIIVTTSNGEINNGFQNKEEHLLETTNSISNACSFQSALDDPADLLLSLRDASRRSSFLSQLSPTLTPSSYFSSDNDSFNFMSSQNSLNTMENNNQTIFRFPVPNQNCSMKYDSVSLPRERKCSSDSVFLSMESRPETPSPNLLTVPSMSDYWKFKRTYRTESDCSVQTFVSTRSVQTQTSSEGSDPDITIMCSE